MAKLKLALLVAEVVMAVAALVGGAGCRSDMDSRLPAESNEGWTEGERIGGTTPGQDNRSYGRGWR